MADPRARQARIRPAAYLAALCLLAGAAVAGCAEEGVAENATVSVYASPPLCSGAERELIDAGRRAGDLRVRLVCLGGTPIAGSKPSAGGVAGRWRLAAIAAGARRAAEDTSAVAYLGPADPAATRFSRPILEEAGIADLAAASGSAAMSRVLTALRRAANSGDGLRETVLDELR